MIALLIGCGEPEGLSARVECEHVEGGSYGEVVEADGSLRPAFDCLGFWRCDEVQPFDGLVDAARDAWSDEPLDTRLWCERCSWSGAPVPLDELGVWRDLAATCSWATP